VGTPITRAARDVKLGAASQDKASNMFP